MALGTEQRQIRDRILAIGRKRGATAKEIKAAIETGLVESGLRNLPGGDADSAGWRQERASLYKDPTNLEASINRFFDETSAVRDKYARAGDLAAAVQRPAAQYRGRYQERAGEAQRLLGGSGGGGGSSGGGGSTRTTTTTTPGVDNRSARAALVQSFLSEKGADPVAFALQARELADVAPTTSTKTQRLPGSAPSSGGGGSLPSGSGIRELFWQGQGGINIKDGAVVPQGFVSGHTDHVHVAAGPETTVELGKIAQSKFGLHVGENPHFGGVAPVHAKNSYHYRAQAIDVSGDAKKMAQFARYVKRYSESR